MIQRWIAVSWWQGEKWTVCLHIKTSSVGKKKTLSEKKNERQEPATLDPFVRSLPRTQTSIPGDMKRELPLI